jgi:CRP/FNR family transcriptional regulator
MRLTLVPKEELLKIFPVIRNQADSLAEKILISSSHQNFRKDTRFYQEGDRCPGIPFFLEGEVRVYKTGSSGREITLYEIFPGETCILNAACILGNRHYPADAVALKDGAMLYLPEKIFQGLIADHPEMRTFIFSLFSLRYHEIIELIEEVTFGKMDVRLEDYLIEKAENNELETTHQVIANDLGTSREVVSRLLKDFERRGNIALSRNRIQLLQLIP